MRSPMSHRFDRRQAIRILALGGSAAMLAACSQTPTASPTAVPAQPTSVPKPTTAAAPVVAPSQAAAAAPAASTAGAGVSDAEWQRIVDAAKGEATLALATYSGTGFRDMVEAFKKAYPGIAVEHSQFQSSSRDYVPRLLQEQKANLYTWDIAIMPTQEMLRQVRPVNGIDPIRPFIVRPDLLQDATWRDGFEGGFNDLERTMGYSIARDIETQIWINTDQVKPGEITKLDDLLDPKWRGKMVGGDPRTKGSAFVPTAMFRMITKSDDVVKKLWVDQEVVLGNDARQLTEFMVRGRYPVSVGAVDRRILADFQEQGLGKNVERVFIPGLEYTNAGSNTMWLITRAPHPNAARVFVNWVLSREGSVVYSEQAQSNSRRVDVSPVEAETAMKPGVTYLKSDAEEFLDEMGKSQEIAKALLN
ncbi:MAG: extracellular solute-binding protein [Chloroflexota bacterium]